MEPIDVQAMVLWGFIILLLACILILAILLTRLQSKYLAVLRELWQLRQERILFARLEEFLKAHPDVRQVKVMVVGKDE